MAKVRETPTARRIGVGLTRLAIVDEYVAKARANPDQAQDYLTWIKQAVEAARVEFERAINVEGGTSD